ncbi:MAG: transposase, partial [Elusimicrobiota bacterium]|nr:transposase [Elusimicrobiota bacterium]
MTKRDGATKNCRKSKKHSKNKKVSRKTSNLYNKYTKPLEAVKIEEKAEQTRIDEYSKKLILPLHLMTMIHFVIEECVSLTQLCVSLKGKDARFRGLEPISKGQLSTVNKTRDYRVFVWIYYELLYKIIHKHHALQRICKDLLIAGIDTTSILIKSYFSALGYCGLTKKVEEGIKLHIGALLGKFTLPITAMITPLNVSDSDEFDNVLTDMGIFIDLHKVILVFDKGYWYYKRFKELADKGIRFIVPMKKGAKYKVIFSQKKGTKKYTDFTIELNDTPNVKFRLVVIHTKDGDLEYLTNVFDMNPLQIRFCYDIRWDMEVF